MIPASTKIDNGMQTFFLMDFLSFHAIIAFVGYPKINSTGEIFILLFPNARILLKTNVFANPQRPLIKNAIKAAKIHIIKTHLEHHKVYTEPKLCKNILRQGEVSFVKETPLLFLPVHRKDLLQWQYEAKNSLVNKNHY